MLVETTDTAQYLQIPLSYFTDILARPISFAVILLVYMCRLYCHFIFAKKNIGPTWAHILSVVTEAV